MFSTTIVAVSVGWPVPLISDKIDRENDIRLPGATQPQVRSNYKMLKFTEVFFNLLLELAIQFGNFCLIIVLEARHYISWITVLIIS